MRHRIAAATVACCLVFAGGTPAAAWAQGGAAGAVDLEIVLAADVSRSIDDREFALQRKGYAAALTDRRVVDAIAAAKNGAIGVCFIEWSGEDDQRVVADWSEIRSEEDGAAVAAVILSAPRSFMGRTSISAAIDFAMARFGKAKWPPARRIVDISGDGTSNAGPTLARARAQAIATGVTINGLAIINDSANSGYSVHTHPPGGLPDYYRRNVIGGPDAFLVVVGNFGSFADAMARKLSREIAGRGAPHLAAR